MISLGKSSLNGVNDFPNEWRARPEVVNFLPSLINVEYPIDPYSLTDAVELFIEKLTQAESRVTILMTGPCSNLVKAIQQEPAIKKKIEKVVWMGGAFTTQGNVQSYQHNGTAEWNVYWDPISSKKLLEMELPLVCIPLDVTNNVPVNKAFLSRLAIQSNHHLSDLAGQFWASTIDTIPSYHYTYFMWDVLATSYLALADSFKVEEVKAIISDRPPNAGQTLLHKDGNSLKIATQVNREVFYDYLLTQLKTDVIF